MCMHFVLAVVPVHDLSLLLVYWGMFIACIRLYSKRSCTCTTDVTIGSIVARTLPLYHYTNLIVVRSCVRPERSSEAI